jgi:hypothetical protein
MEKNTSFTPIETAPNEVAIMAMNINSPDKMNMVKIFLETKEEYKC